MPDYLSVSCDYGGITYLGSLCSNWNSRNVKDYNKDSSDPIIVLENLKLKNNRGLVNLYLYINSISNKFDNLKLIIHDKTEILVLTENKQIQLFH